jgi:hypothetical protein
LLTRAALILTAVLCALRVFARANPTLSAFNVFVIETARALLNTVPLLKNGQPFKGQKRDA